MKIKNILIITLMAVPGLLWLATWGLSAADAVPGGNSLYYTCPMHPSVMSSGCCSPGGCCR